MTIEDSLYLDHNCKKYEYLMIIFKMKLVFQYKFAEWP